MTKEKKLKIVSDCFGVLMKEGDHVMLSVGSAFQSEFRQGVIDRITDKRIHVAELGGDGKLLRQEVTMTDKLCNHGIGRLVIHRRKAVGLIRVFTQEEHEEMKNEQEAKSDTITTE